MIVMQAVAPRFEVASVKPHDPAEPVPFNTGSMRVSPEGDLTLIRIPMYSMIAQAYDISASVNNSLPMDKRWAPLLTQLFDLQGKGGTGSVADRLRTLLEDRFGLRAHWETRQVPVYALTVKTPGKLRPSTEHCFGIYPYLTYDTPTCRIIPTSRIRGAERFHSAGSINDLITRVAMAKVREPIIDQTGLAGNYEWDVEFGLSDRPDVPMPTVFSAFEDQLGLTLTKTTGPWRVLVIDAIHEPTPN